MVSQELEAQEAKNLTQESVLQFLESFLKDNKQRRKLSVHVQGSQEVSDRSTEQDSPSNTNTDDCIHIKDLWSFKSRCEVFSAL